MAATASDTIRTFAGQRAEIPAPRARTPSPIKKVVEAPLNEQPLPRDFDFRLDELDVIYAEDEEIFRDHTIQELIKAGFRRENIYESENGMGALEDLAKLQVAGNMSRPLVVLLDVRMPYMDGRECALQIQQLVQKHLLRREPFVISISSLYNQVIVEEGKGNFQVVLPKPFFATHIEDKSECVTALRNWWSMGIGRQLPAWKKFDLDMIDIIAGDTEAVCRMYSTIYFVQAGVDPKCVFEASDEEELSKLVTEAQAGDVQRPLILLLGRASWAAPIRAQLGDSGDRSRVRRDPFIVCTAHDSDRLSKEPVAKNFHAFLPPNFAEADMRWCVELCRLWWLTRGEGPAAEPDTDSEPEDQSDAASDAE